MGEPGGTGRRDHVHLTLMFSRSRRLTLTSKKGNHRDSVATFCYAAIEGQTWQARKLRFQSKTQKHSRISLRRHLSFSRGTTRRTSNNRATIQIIRGASSGKCSTIFGIVESRNRPHNAHHNRAVANGASTAKRFYPRLRFMVLL